MGMSSVSGIVEAYFSTLKNQRTGRANKGARATQFGIPLIIGIAWAIAGPLIKSPSNAIVGISIVSALLCSMAAILFQTRIDLKAREKSGDNTFITKNDLILIDELFRAVVWGILFGLAVVLLMVVSEWFELPEAEQTQHCWVIAKLISGLTAASVAHFVFVVGTILKRLSRVYELVATEKRLTKHSCR